MAIVLLVAAIVAGGWYVVSPSLGSCPPGPDQQASGIVLSVAGTSVADVRSFVLRTAAGEQLTIAIGRLDLVNGFNAGHLREHQATAAPVIAQYRLECDRLVAFRLTDAPTGGTIPIRPLYVT